MRAFGAAAFSLLLASLMCSALGDDVEGWKCGPSGSCVFCPACEGCPATVCVGGECGARRSNVQGELLVLDVNSLTYNGGPNHPPRVVNAADCCDQCKKTEGCNAWVFCSKREGCGSGCSGYVNSLSDKETSSAPNTGGTTKAFGPFGSCNDDKWPWLMCSLKHVADASNPDEVDVGPNSDWVSGIVEEAKTTEIEESGDEASWKCGLEGSCIYGVCNETSCVGDDCHPRRSNLQGDVVKLDVNSLYYIGGPNHPPTVTNALQCCNECKKTPGCNAWTYCNSKEGCGSGCSEYVKINGGTSPPYPNGASSLPITQFGQFGGCNGDKWPWNICTLKNVQDTSNVEEHDLDSYWVSGTL